MSSLAAGPAVVGVAGLRAEQAEAPEVLPLGERAVVGRPAERPRVVGRRGQGEAGQQEGDQEGGAEARHATRQGSGSPGGPARIAGPQGNPRYTAAMALDELLRLLRALHEQQVEYVLVGGAAINLHGILRATEDVDLFVRPTEENVARLRRALASLWEDAAIEGIRTEDLDGRYPTIRYGPPDGDLAIDILSRLGTAFDFDDLDFETVDVEGVPVRLATPETLYRMKRNTLRDVDRADAAALRRLFGLED